MSLETSWNPESYAKNARFVSDLGEPLLQLLAPQSGESIFDLGCGDGALTEKIAAAGAFVYAADSSFAQVEAAHRRGLNAFVMDGRQIALKRSFDAVFTNAVLHWVQPPGKVVEGVARCLKPGGRFVGEFGGQGNVETIRAALHTALRRRGTDSWSVDPWYYPAAGEYSKLLSQFGFTVQYCELTARPTKLPGDILDWLGVFAQPFTHSLPEPARESFLREVRTAVQPTLQKSDGSWFADYVRLRFKAVALR